MATKSRRKIAHKLKKPGKGHGADIFMIVMVALVAYALVYSLVFLEGPSYFGDDSVYLSLAHTVLQGNFAESSYIFSVRLLNILPTALFYKLFGVNLLTDSLWDIISFLGIIVVSFYMGKELYNGLAGVVAALLACFFPLLLQLSTTVSDDIPMAFVSALAMLALLYGIKRHSKRWYFAAGILFISAVLVTPEGAIIDIVGGLYVLIMLISGKIKLDRTFLYLPAGFFASIAVLAVVNYALSGGNPFITFTLNSNFYSAVGQPNTIPSTDTNPAFYINAMFPYSVVNQLSSDLQRGVLNPISIWERIYAIDYNNAGFFFYALVVASVYLLVKRERRAYFALFYFAIAFLYLEFGPMHVSLSPFNYLLSYRLARFLTIIAVPTVVIIGIAVARSVEKGSVTKRRIAIALSFLSVIFLIATAVPINFMWYEITHYETYDQMAIANYLNVLSNSTRVYFPDSHPYIPMFMHFDNTSRLISYYRMDNCSNVTANSYVVTPGEEQFGINYTQMAAQCTTWEQVSIPPIAENYPGYITSTGNFAMAKLYYVT